MVIEFVLRVVAEKFIKGENKKTFMGIKLPFT